MRVRPKILLVALETDWPSSARLPRALQVAGFEVGVACRATALMAHTRFRDHFFLLPPKYYGKALLAGLETIHSAWSPDLIMPMDDRAALFLTRAYERMMVKGDPRGLGLLLERSLGNPMGTREALSKRRTAEVARRLGIRVPAGQVVESAGEAINFAHKHGCPVILKQSSGNGGFGVYVCQNEAEIHKVFEALKQQRTIGMRLKHWRERFRGRIMTADWLPRDESLTVSQFIKGKCATSLAAVVKGQMLAVLTAEVMQTYLGDNGPSSVIRLVRNDEMCRVSQTMLKHWGLTGLAGFDFILDEANQAWLLECNPRPTTLSHLGARVGDDLCATLRQGVSSAPEAHPQTQAELVIAHYPQEIWRAPDSPYLKTAFHDVPADDPLLLAAFKQSAPQREHRV